MKRSVIIVPEDTSDSCFSHCREVYIDNSSEGLQVAHGFSYREYSYNNNLGIECGVDIGYVWGVNYARMGFLLFQQSDDMMLVFVPYFISEFQKNWFRNSGIKNYLENKQLGIISAVMKDGKLCEESRSMFCINNYDYLCNRLLGTDYVRVKK